MDEDRVAVIRQRRLQVMEQIAAAALRSGRQPDAVRLVVVTKAQPLGVVQAAIQAGAAVLGENYAEEAAAKITALGQTAVEWHMIGHVQSRKAGLVVEHFDCLQSLDSLKLAARLDRFCRQNGRQLRVLLECNVSGEASKYGFSAWEEAIWPGLLPVVDAIRQLQGLRIAGLMTMPPFFEDPEKTRPYFRRLRRLQHYLAQRIPDLDLSALSMGTSIDYVCAVEEGATLVRVGTAIVGPRPA